MFFESVCSRIKFCFIFVSTFSQFYIGSAQFAETNSVVTISPESEVSEAK